jgi:hypothetical protein
MRRVSAGICVPSAQARNLAFEGVKRDVDAYEYPGVKRHREDASRVRAIDEVAKGRSDTMKRWTKLIQINFRVEEPTNRIR